MLLQYRSSFAKFDRKSIHVRISRLLICLGLSMVMSTIAVAQCRYTGSPPTAVSKKLTEVRVLVQNIFGLDKDGNARCKRRARALGRHIATLNPMYDIVSLQEHWNSWDFGIKDCDADLLSRNIWATGRYHRDDNYYRHKPHGEWSDLETDGGLSTFTSHSIQLFRENEWDHIPRDNGIKVLHGSTFARIKLRNSITLDVYNVHLLAEGADGCDEACRREELQELRQQIIANSRRSGNPVIVMGDFNIGGPPSCTGNRNYQDIMQVLDNPRDLWLENHPALPGFTADCVNNSLLRRVSSGGSCQHQERIDYIFIVDSPALSNSDIQVVVRQPQDIQVARIPGPDGPVSDHFGLDVTLEIRRPGRVNTQLRGLANKCMNVDSANTADGTRVELYECNNSRAQQWTLRHDGTLRGLAGKCLTVRNASTANHTPTELRRCDGGAYQRFDYTRSEELRSRLNPNKCVEVKGGVTSNHTQVQLYNCNGTASQRWRDYAPSGGGSSSGGGGSSSGSSGGADEPPICVKKPYLPQCVL